VSDELHGPDLLLVEQQLPVPNG